MPRRKHSRALIGVIEKFSAETVQEQKSEKSEGSLTFSGSKFFKGKP